MRIFIFSDPNLHMYVSKGWKLEQLLSGTVNTLSSRRFPVENVEDNTTIKQLKEKIEDLEGIPIDDQIIKKATSAIELKDEVTLAQSIVFNDSTLILWRKNVETTNWKEEEDPKTMSTKTAQRRPTEVLTLIEDPNDPKKTEDKNEPWWQNSSVSGPLHKNKQRKSENTTTSTTTTTTNNNNDDKIDEQSNEQTPVVSNLSKEEQDKQRKLRLQAIEARMKQK